MLNTKLIRWLKIIFMVLAVLTGLVFGYLFWLTEYSSIYVVGAGTKTHERSPAWSPDGKYIAYLCGYSYPSDGWDDRSWNNPGWGGRTSEVCVKDLETSQVLQITKFGRDKFEPIWSPDGKMLIWFDGRNKLITIYDFENKKTLANLTDTNDCGDLFWSKDNQRLLSSCGNFTLELSTLKISSFPSTIEIDDRLLSPNETYFADTVELINTDNVISPALQRYRQAHGSNPYVVTITQNGNTIYKGDYWVLGYTSFSWLPQGDILQYLRHIDVDDAKWDLDLAFLYVPTGETALFKLDDVCDFFWSPSGKRMACKTDEDSLKVIDIEFQTNPFRYVIVKSQSFPLNKSSNNDSFGEELIWSPDENYIAFSYSQFKENFGEAIISFAAKIWLIDLRTGAQKPLNTNL